MDKSGRLTFNNWYENTTCEGASDENDDLGPTNSCFPDTCYSTYLVNLVSKSQPAQKMASNFLV